MKTSVVLIAVAFLAGVQGTCDPDTIKNIKAFWNGKAPQDILEHLNGTITYLTAPSYYAKNADSIECFQTILNGDSSATDIVIYHDDTTSANVNYQINEEDGFLTLTSDDFDAPEKVYILYLSNSVMAFFHCQDTATESFSGFAGVAVINASDDDIDDSPEIAKGLKAADAAIAAVKLVTLAGIDTNCGD
uniref:Lipocalin/cytosolic fatty-acid binding domain-containing protein n=1 Tax=Graphocephala atropunctata TaxID=36148 RepID=A0A1B6LUR2_9HEMI